MEQERPIWRVSPYRSSALAMLGNLRFDHLFLVGLERSQGARLILAHVRKTLTNNAHK